MTNITRRKLLLATTAAAGATLLPSLAPAQESYSGFKGELGLFTTINRREKGLTAEEKKHVPVITLPKKYKEGEIIPVNIKLGEIPHPMEDEHWIERIHVFTDTGIPVAEIEFDGRSNVAAEATIHVKAEDAVTLVVQSFCNLHGIWESRATMKTA